ncbi:hypothetical protein, partial [Allofournierella massiliensis]
MSNEGIAAGRILPRAALPERCRSRLSSKAGQARRLFKKPFTFRRYSAYFDIIPQLPAASTAKTEFHIHP